MRQSATNNFTGSMNKDVDPRLLSPGDYVEAWNLLNTDGSRPGAMQNILSTKQKSAGLAVGSNWCIAAAEDKINQSIVYFIWNSLGGHKVIRHWLKTESSVELLSGAYLGFEKHLRIQAVIIDGRYLYWTNGRSDGTTIYGSEPHKVDMERAGVSGKYLTHEIYAGVAGEGQFANTNTYTVTVKNATTGATVATATYTADGTYLDDPEGGLQWLAGQLSSLSTHIEIDICNCKITVGMTAQNRYIEVTSSANDILYAPLNYYSAPLATMETYMTAWAKEVPTCQPVCTYTSDPTIPFNNVKDGYFQFRYRFVYDSGEESAWSEISPIASNCNYSGVENANLNAIEIDFSDSRLIDPKWLGMIRYIDIAYRDGNNDTFKRIERIEACKFGVLKQKIVWTNSDIYTEVPSDDLSAGASDSQVLSLFHNLPRVVGAVSTIADQDGNSRIVVGAGLEGYDQPDCYDVDFTIVESTEDCLIDIIGTVSIQNSASEPSADMRFNNKALDGFVVYLAGTKFYAVSNNPNDGTGDGSFTIKGVPRGAYCLRVASYMCRFNNDFGPRYNMLNGLEWQKTSCPCINIAGSVAATGFKTERVLDLRTFTGATFDLDTEVGYGEVILQNAHHRTEARFSSNVVLVEVYTNDFNGEFDTQEKREGADQISTINQVQFYKGYTTTSLTTISPESFMMADHNGYAWVAYTRDNAFAGECLRVVVTPFGDDPTDPAPQNHMFVTDNSHVGAGWNDIFTDDVIDQHSAVYPNIIVVSSTLVGKIWHGFMYNGSPGWTLAHKTTYSGKVTDVNGTPLSGVIIWMAVVHDWAVTNILGEYTLSIYAYEGDVFKASQQRVYALYLDDTCATGVFDPLYLETVRLFDTDSNDLAEPFTDQDFTSSVAGGIVCNDRHLKSGERYKTGVIYEDVYGRTAGVLPSGEVDIPFHTEDGIYTRRSFDWAINHAPPDWAVRYHIVRSKGSRYLTWQHISAIDVKYANIPDGSRTVSIVPYGSGSVSHVLIQIPTFVEDTGTTSPLLLLFDANVVRGYKAKYGDRCRYLLDEVGNTFITGSIVEQPIIGEYVDGEKYFIVIKYDELGKEAKPGSMFEFYTPKNVQDDIYYSTGVCYPILSPGTAGRRHKGQYQDQTFGPDLPATGNIQSGDTYWNETRMWSGTDSYLKTVECYYKPGAETRGEDLGKPFIVDQFAKETFYFNRLRISGLYKPNSATNWLSNFGSEDFKHVDRTFGPIKVMGMVGDTLLVICEHRAQPVYVGKDRMIDLSGNSTIGRTTAILNIASESRADAGTTNPESFVCQDGRAWWWDQHRSKVWQYSQAGVDDISGGMINYLHAISGERKYLDFELNYTPGGFDRRNGVYILTFVSELFNYLDGDDIASTASTIAYAPFVDRPGWKCHFDFTGDCYVSVADQFIGFSLGTINYHNVGSNSGQYCRLYNIQKDAWVRYVVNEMPTTQKEFKVLRIDADNEVFCPEMRIDKVSDAAAMSTRMLRNKWLSATGQQWTEVRRDGNDPSSLFNVYTDPAERYSVATMQGRRMIGDHADIKIQAVTPSQKIVIFAADTEFAISQQTK